jgi:hypothetical protein
MAADAAALKTTVKLVCAGSGTPGSCWSRHRPETCRRSGAGVPLALLVVAGIMRPGRRGVSPFCGSWIYQPVVLGWIRAIGG